ncbi:hypothetical protein B0I35DRAFT_436896 [Stachybotrys elegans]|uniref:Uncharacterized protein n=1 Tax=Stachybotrys elegans TaxID=80388 RepID=A0A8K0SM73_9HYPO|nr:hypothetical protein B0I35DRAFT_436896 [Stachybotrys elegans]
MAGHARMGVGEWSDRHAIQLVHTTSYLRNLPIDSQLSTLSYPHPRQTQLFHLFRACSMHDIIIYIARLLPSATIFRRTRRLTPNPSTISLLRSTRAAELLNHSHSVFSTKSTTTASLSANSPSVSAVKMTGTGTGEIIDLHSLAARGSSQLDAQLLDILDAHVNASTPPDTTAAELDKLYPAGASSEDAENFLWNLWTLFERVVRKIPAGDDRHQGLISVVEKLKSIDRETIQLWGKDTKVWSDLPMLGPTMREAWNTRPALDGTGQDASSIAEWVSLNSFAARALSASLQPWENFAIWELRAALEETSTSSTARDSNLASSSEWFIHAGKVLYDLGRHPVELSETDARALRTGELLDAKPGFSEERWKFWSAKMKEMAKQAEAKTLKERAEKALDVIMALEK